MSLARFADPPAVVKKNGRAQKLVVVGGEQDRNTSLAQGDEDGR
jgi:hypothetical protein